MRGTLKQATPEVGSPPLGWTGVDKSLLEVSTGDALQDPGGDGSEWATCRKTLREDRVDRVPS